jgi:hypothetical protein
VGAWLTRQALEAATFAVAGSVVLGGTLAGCGNRAAVGRHPGPWPATSSAPAPGSPVPGMIAGSFPPTAQQPAGSCPFVSQQQVAAALGQPVQHVRGCAYSFAHGAGSVGVITDTYSSPATARECLNEQASGQRFKVSKIPGLGTPAESVVTPQWTVAAVLIRGAKWLEVVIFWRLAARHPEMAVTLLRDAAANFGKYTSGVQFGC